MKKKISEPILDENGRPPLKLNYPQTFKVGFAFAIIMLFWTAYDFVVPLLLEHAYGLPNSLRGLIMGLDNLLSLFMLPLFGKLSDNAHGKLAQKFGRRTPFIVIGTLASVALMVFVPVATLKQQQKAEEYASTIEAQLNDPAFMQDKLSSWYSAAEAGEDGASNFCDLNYLAKNNVTRERFISIRYDAKLTSEKSFLGLFGDTTYFYDGVEIENLDASPKGGDRTYRQILQDNADYDKFVASGMNNYISDSVYNNVTKVSGKASLAIYMVILLLVLVAMATFRSPAVALMPDVTPKPLRSQGNAVINLCGGIGGAIAFLIYTVVLFGERLENYVIIFASVAAGMLLLLAGFMAFVKERKMVKKCREICKEYGIDDFADGSMSEMEKLSCNDAFSEDENEKALPDMPDAPDMILQDAHDKAGITATVESKRRFRTKKSAEEKARLISFWLILGSIFMWFMGYNAISSNLSVYTTKELNLSAGVASIISGVSMGISAIAFIPVGYLAAKIGRRKSIIIGFSLAVVSFILVFAFVKTNDNALIPSVLFSLFYLIAGFGLIIANVNTFPMVTELSTSSTVGQYTGYYYMATMSAQAITPALGGLVMDHISNRGLFVYSAICVAIAIVLMLFVKHGDSIKLVKGRRLTKDEKKQLRLEALDAD